MEELIFRPKKLKRLGLFIVSILLTAASITFLFTQNIFWIIFGVIGIIFFGAGIVATFLNLMPNSCYLKLNESGFEFKGSFRKTFIKWDDVQKFYVTDPSAKMGIKSIKVVAFDFSNSYNKQELAREIARNIGGSEAALPDTYGKKPEELAELMNSWKKKFSKNK